MQQKQAEVITGEREIVSLWGVLLPFLLVLKTSEVFS